MRVEEGKTRKVRSDKKVPVAPYIHDNHRVWLNRISLFMNRIPEGVVGVRLVTAALYDEETIQHFARYFKRSFHYTPEVWFPGQDGEALDVYTLIDTSTIDRVRQKLKFSQPVHKQLTEFQIALGISYTAHAAKLLLEYSLNNLHMIRKIAPAIQQRDYMTAPKPPQPIIQKKHHDPKRERSAFSILNKKGFE